MPTVRIVQTVLLNNHGEDEMNERIYYSKEAELRARRSSTMVAILASLLGASAGIVVALLLAPRRGDEVRGELARGANEFLEGARQTGETLGEQAGRTVQQVRERIEERVNHA